MHGSRNQYLNHGCRCSLCRNANAVYQRRWRRLNGDEPRRLYDTRVDPIRARAHVALLRERGLGLRAIAAAAGIAFTSILYLVNGRSKSIRLSTEIALLAIDVETARADGAYVSSRRARTALGRLLALGFRNGEIGTLLGQRRARGGRVDLGKRCRLKIERGLEGLLARARAGELAPRRPPTRRELQVSARMGELLELRQRGVELVAGELLKAELAELRRMKRAS